jgi:hypothetical protein
MFMRTMGGGLALVAVLLASGCSCWHKHACPAPTIAGAPAPCCGPAAPVPAPAPGAVAVPAAPTPAPQYYSGPPPVVNGFGH